MLSLVGLIVASPPVIAAEPSLGSEASRKAAVKCQKVIAQTTAKVLTGKLKALDACGNAALTCVHTKQTDGACPLKATQLCDKKLRGFVATADKARAKIVASKDCAAKLDLLDLLSADGLGLGRLAEQCDALDLNVCSGIAPLATCLVRLHERGAGGLYGAVRPRMDELLGTLPSVVPAIEGLPKYPGCATCSVSPSDRKPVEECGKAISKAAQALVGTLVGKLESCGQGVFACVQTKGSSTECLAKARAACAKGRNAITAATAKFAAGVAKKCAETKVDFDQLSSPLGLNFAALAADCAARGGGTPTSHVELATCLQRQAECTAVDLAARAVGRFGEDEVSREVQSAFATSCVPSQPLSVPLAVARERAGVFGSILKFVKQVTRPSGGVTGVRQVGTRPAPTSKDRGIRIVSGPARVVFGGITKISFAYRVGGTKSLAGARAAGDPELIVALDGPADSASDFFTVALDPTVPTDSDREDVLEITFADEIPSCAFTLLLATSVGGEISEYTPVVLVVDPDFPSPTPTGAATPGGGSATPTLGPTATPSASAATPTATRTATPTPTATPLVPTPTPTATLPPPFVVANPPVAIVRLARPENAGAAPNIIVGLPPVTVLRPE